MTVVGRSGAGSSKNRPGGPTRGPPFPQTKREKRARLDSDKRASNASGAIWDQYQELEKNREGSKLKDGKERMTLTRTPERGIRFHQELSACSPLPPIQSLKRSWVPCKARQFKPKGKGLSMLIYLLPHERCSHRVTDCRSRPLDGPLPIMGP